MQICMKVVPLSTDFRKRPIHVEVGFDYAQAIRKINQVLTYDEIAECCGYEGARGVRSVVEGAIPSHPKGEAIWALFVELFGKRPQIRPPQIRQSIASPMTS